jgi:adenylate kinase family enzyme
MDPERLARIAVVGTSCAGKTTLARSLSRALGVPHTELDVLHWGPAWTKVDPAEFRARVRVAVSEPRWVIDGNYSVVQDLVWARATTLVWLNYPFSLIYTRAWSRTLRRVITREPLFAGNRESLRGIVDPEWIPWWVLRTFWRRRREYPRLLAQAEFAHLQVIEFTDPRQAQRFLQGCARGPRPTASSTPSDVRAPLKNP